MLPEIGPTLGWVIALKLGFVIFSVLELLK